MKVSTSARLLIVDDETTLLKALCDTLKLEGYTAVGFTSAAAALTQLRDQPFDILLTDLMMPEMDGISLLQAAQRIDRDLACVIMTGHGTIDTAVQALQSGATDYVLKPLRLDNMLLVINRALATRRLQMENIRLRELVSIYELARAITMDLTHDEIVQRTLAAAMQQNDAAAVCVLAPSEDGRELRVAGTRGLDAARPPNARIEMDPAVVKWISTAREQLSAWDGSAPVQAVFEQPFKGLPCAVALPIVAGGNFYGVLGFSSQAPQRRMSSGQIKALDILASTAASAFEAASLLGQLKAMNKSVA